MQDITFEEASVVVSPTVRKSLAELVRDPGMFVRQWNYKGAILSGGLRAPIFLITYLIGRESIKLALSAAVLQFVFRFVFAGLSGALIQSFRRVEPVWKAMITILLVVPLISHVFEYLLQWSFVHITATTDHTDMAIARSICVSLFSVLFALFIMRRGVMIVGDDDSMSLWSDVRRLPFLIYEFVAFIPNEISLMLRRGAYLGVVISIAAFGVFSQFVCWAVTNKAFWTYRGGNRIAGIRFWGVDGVILMILAVTFFSFAGRFSAFRITKASSVDPASTSA
jgi:hypothetical protein